MGGLFKTKQKNKEKKEKKCQVLCILGNKTLQVRKAEVSFEMA